MEIFDDFGGEGMSFTGFSVTVVAGVSEVERFASRHNGFECGAMADDGFLGDFLETDAADFGRDAGEGEIDDFRADANGFECLSALVGVEHRDAHFGHDFENAFFEGFEVVGHRLGGRDVAEFAFPLVHGDELPDGGKAEIRAYGGRAEAEAAGDLVNIADFSGFDHERGTHAFADAVEVVMDGADGKQGRNRNPLGGSSPVREYQDAVIAFDGIFDFFAKRIEAGFETRGPGSGGPGAVDHERWESVLAEVFDFFELVLKEDRAVERDGFAVLGCFIEQVALRAKARSERHDRPFADRIDGGIGDLGEELLEIGVKQSRIA